MCRGKILYCIAMLKRHKTLFSQRSKLSNNKGYLGEKGKFLKGIFCMIKIGWTLRYLKDWMTFQVTPDNYVGHFAVVKTVISEWSTLL